MRRGLIELQEAGRMSQGRFEASMAPINDLNGQREILADTPMSEISAIKK